MPWDFWLIFLFLSVVIPWRGYTRLKKLLALPSVDTKEKLALYAVTIALQWMLVGLVFWRSVVRGLTIQELGLRSGGWAGILAAGVFGAIFIGGLQWLNLRRIGKMEGEAPELLRKLASRLLPVNLLEYLPYSAFAIRRCLRGVYLPRIRNRWVIQGRITTLAGRDRLLYALWLGSCLSRPRRNCEHGGLRGAVGSGQ